MKKYIKNIMLIFGVVVLAACGTSQEKTEAPKPPVNAAEAASAIMAADIAIGKAKDRKNLWRDTGKILDKADNAMTADSYREAYDLANKARAQADDAVTQSYRGDALFLITTMRKDYIDQMYTDQKTRLESASAALDGNRVEEAYDTAFLLMAELRAQMDGGDGTSAVAEAPKPEPEPEPVSMQKPQTAPASTPSMSKDGKNAYTVNRKDNLWDIAAKPEVYGNADMWPLLWKANKDKISKPDEIPSGLSLVIDRNASSEDIAAAIKYSKLRGAPSLGPVDAFDQKYISK